MRWRDALGRCPRDPQLHVASPTGRTVVSREVVTADPIRFGSAWFGSFLGRVRLHPLRATSRLPLSLSLYLYLPALVVHLGREAATALLMMCCSTPGGLDRLGVDTLSPLGVPVPHEGARGRFLEEAASLGLVVERFLREPHPRANLAGSVSRETTATRGPWRGEGAAHPMRRWRDGKPGTYVSCGARRLAPW